MTNDEHNNFMGDLHSLLEKYDVGHFGACGCCDGTAADGLSHLSYSRKSGALSARDINFDKITVGVASNQ